MLSINAKPFMRATFASFAIETTWTVSTAAIGGGKCVTEPIICDQPS